MRRAALVVGVTVITVGGVTSPSTGAAGHTRSDGATVAQTQALTPASTLDRDAAMVQATKDVPEFGGAFVDKAGALHVWLTRPSAGTAARARSALDTRLGLTAAGTATVAHRADYSFAQLKTWHDGMIDVLAVPGVTMTDIDERTNRLTVGVEDAGLAASAVASVLAKVGIPKAAVTVVTATAVKEILRDRTRPLHGGTQIVFGTGGSTCTLGFPVNRGGDFGFMTNSHCSTTRGVVDSGSYWQPTRPTGGGDAVGVETVDPPMFTGVGCPAGRSCRFSDANFVRTNGSTGIMQGRIARPPVGSVDWNGTDTFRINTVGQAFSGDRVEKVGRTTGRTVGNVTSTCVNSNVAGTTFTYLCQDRASLASAGGDSGSPVFVLTNNPAPNDVRAVGILRAGNATVSEYSPIFQVRQEVGAMRICAVDVSEGC